MIEPGASWSVPSLYCAAAAIARARLRIFGPFHGRSSRYCLPLAPPRSGDRFGGLSGGMVGWFGARRTPSRLTLERKEVRRRVALKACSAFSLLTRSPSRSISFPHRGKRPAARTNRPCNRPPIHHGLSDYRSISFSLRPPFSSLLSHFPSTATNVMRVVPR